jgi:hypothetical protein
MPDTTECFMYLESLVVPGQGTGRCLQVHETKKDGTIECRFCEDVLAEGNCPRNHKSPYLKAGERS